MTDSPLWRLLGVLLLAVSSLFLVWQVMAVWQKLPQLSVSAAFVRAVVAAAFGYTLPLSLLAMAWGGLMRVLSPDHHLPWSRYWRIFMRMQAPKYLPGNIFHYVGRVELLGRQGVPRQTAVLGLVHEGVLLAAVALVFGAAGLWLTSMALGEFTTRFSVVAAICLGALPVLWIFYRRRAGEWRKTVMLGRAWLLAGTLYLLFFLFMAAVLWMLAQLAGHALPPGLCLAAATVPWLLGFVAPGAPGGLGVREAVMLMLLKPVIPAVDALLLVLALRLVTLFGDLLALPLSYLPLRGEARQ